MTRTLSSGTRNASASSVRTPNGRCVPVHTVSFPSCHSATAERGSNGTCAMYGMRYEASNVRTTPAGICSACTAAGTWRSRSEEHTSELQSLAYLVCRLLLEKKKTKYKTLPSISRKHGDNELKNTTRQTDHQ